MHALPADTEGGHLGVLAGTCWQRTASQSWRACPRCSRCLRAACGASATATAWAGGRRRATALGRTSGGRTARCTVRKPAARARRRLIRPPCARSSGTAKRQRACACRAKMRARLSVKVQTKCVLPARMLAQGSCCAVHTFVFLLDRRQCLHKQGVPCRMLVGR